jgi:hypothetical protein
LLRAVREEWDRDRTPPYDEVVDEIVKTVRTLDRRSADDKEEHVRVVGADQPATTELVQQALEDQPEIVHYIGHGRALHDERYLAFADPDSEEPDWTSVTKFAESIDEDQPPILVFLHLCQGPRSMPALEGSLARGNFSTLASELIRRRVSMVVAMQYPASADVGLTFTRRFYEYLSQGRTVAEAVQNARKGVKNSLPVGGPVLYLRGEDGAILRPRGKVDDGAADDLAGQSRAESSAFTTQPPALSEGGIAASRPSSRATSGTGFDDRGGKRVLFPKSARDLPPPQKAATAEGADTINVGRGEERP